MKEKEVKNEVPAPETATGKEPEKQGKEKKELTPQQIQQRKKMLVYPLMGLVFLGSMYLIFAPSDKDEAKVESVGGFNADIPQPKGDGIISDKKTAYEQEQMENKQADKMRSLQDFAFSLGEENGEDLTLIDDAPAEKPKKKYKPKPYEQMTHPGERVQVDVKVVPRRCIADPELRLFQYTAIDEFTRLRFLAAYPEQSTYSSADFLRRLRAWYARRGIQVECVQTDNGFEFTNRFSNSKRDLPTLFENTAAELGIRHKLIRPYTPRHNGKVERSHREDQKRFYSCHTFYSLEDFAKQLAVHNRRSNNFPMRPLRWLSPAEFTVQYV